MGHGGGHGHADGYAVPVSGKEPSRGPADALVTIVEFSDFQCPFCARVQPTLEKLLARYGEDIRIVWMNHPLPFHSEAHPAATAALAAFEQGGNEKFWAYHDALFSSQRSLSRRKLLQLATRLELDAKDIEDALERNRYAWNLRQEAQLAERLGARGTPSFFINGRLVMGAQPLEVFAAVIDDELEHARALVEKGVPRDEVYARTIAWGHTRARAVRAARPHEGKVYALVPPRDAPRRGGTQPKVVIQTFSDFECPFCRRVLPTLARIERHYGDRVQIVWRPYPLPFHEHARLAARAAIEVHDQGGDAKFWAYHDLLFRHQNALRRADLERYAKQVGGIDLQKFRSALDRGAHDGRIQSHMNAVKAAGVEIGTPSFFINGRLLMGAQPFAAFKEVIDRALADAR